LEEGQTEDSRHEYVQVRGRTQVLEQRRRPRDTLLASNYHFTFTEIKETTTSLSNLQTLTITNTINMKLSLSIMSIMLTGALAVSIKRQNDVPMCEEGKFEEQRGPYSSSKQNDPI
jgi:hypothetical protein